MARPKIDDPEAKAKILLAAEELFAARGYAGAGIRDIATGAGVNGAMIHYYFGNKEGLYHAIIDSAAARVQQMLVEAIGGAHSTEQRLTRFVSAYAEYIFTHPNLARILHRELLSGAKHLKEISQPMINYTMLRETLMEGKRRGELRHIDVELAPISLMGMIVIFQIIKPVISGALGKDGFDAQFIKRLSTHTIDLFLKGAGKNDRARLKKSAARTAKKQQSARRRAQVKR